MGKGSAWPTGIYPQGAGYRIKIFKHGRVYYSETIKGKTKATLAEAVKRREWLVTRVNAGLPIKDETTDLQLFAEVATDYLDTLEGRESTIREYHRIINNWWMVFDGYALQDITSAMIKRELARMKVSSKTKKNRLIPLYGVFNHAEIRPPRIKLKKDQRAKIERYTPEERDSILNRLDGQERVYFSLLFATGLRPGEALALTWQDYDGEFLNVSKSISKRVLGPTKTAVSRRVYVPTWSRSYILKHNTRFRGGHVFTNSKGGVCLDSDQFNAQWRQAHRKAHIPYRIPYICRHTRAAELLSAGVIPARAAKELGHSVEMFLRIYSEFIEEYSETNMEQFEGVAQND